MTAPPLKTVLRTESLFREHRERIFAETSRIFALLMFGQFVGGILAAWALTPRFWAAEPQFATSHLYLAVFLGGIIASLPIAAALIAPTATSTRHVIAVGQILTSALLIHLTGGRIETHFHIFGSLALLAFYRDWKVLLTAAGIATADHFLRGYFLPQSIYGVLSASSYRTLEHSAWVVFEVLFLIQASQRATKEMREIAETRAQLESAHDLLEAEAIARNADLRDVKSELVHARERFDRAVEGSADGLWEWPDVERPELWLSARLAELLGYDGSDLPWSFEHFQTLLHPQDLPRVSEAIEHHVTENLPYDLEYRLLCKNGEYRWFRSRGKKFSGSQASVFGMAGALSDIHDRKLMEAAIRESEERFRSMADSAPTMIWMADAQKCSTYINQAFVDFTGRSSEGELAPGWLNGVHPNDVDALNSRISACYEAHEAFAVEYRLRSANGEYRWVLDYGRAVFELDGRFRGYIGSCIDVQVRKESETELLRAKELAEAATRSKGDFLANMSHEIRTPLNGVLGMTDLLLLTSLESAQRKYVETVRSCGSALLAVVNDILDFSKMEAGMLSLKPHQFDVQGVINETVNLLDYRMHEKDIEFAMVIGPEVPPKVIGDSNRLKQILLNLLSNALKFTPRSGAICLKITALNDREPMVTLEFSVTDSGIGIPLAEQRKIFEPFAQADTTSTRNYGGTGLGLSISRQMVELMGGQMQVRSEPGRGSVFIFTVRMRRPEPVRAEVTKTESPNPSAEVPATFIPLTILVADDNEVNQRLARALLEHRGHHVLVAANGAEACALFAQNRCDIVLMDIQMPVMDGLEATRRIREANLDQIVKVPIVAVTANAMEGDESRYRSAGLDGYLSKPYNAKALYQIVDDMTR